MSKRIVCLFIAMALGEGITGMSIALTPLGVLHPATIDYPEGQAPSEAEVNLGKTLFFDKRLSSQENIACASCHNPDLGFGDGMAHGRGTLGNQLGRNTPHLYNLAWNSVFFWDGRAASLEEQAL